MTDTRVLVTCPLLVDEMDEYADRLAAHGIEYDVVEVDQHLTESELLGVIDGYEGVLAGDDEFSRTVLRAADRLEVIAKWGVGTDNIDREAAAEFGITVANTPDAFGDEVADVVLGYVILLARELHHVDRAVRRGEWATPRGVSLADRTLGVIGLGDIGCAVARRAHAHEMHVIGSDVRPFPASLRREIDVERVETDDLLDRSDVVSLNCALTEDTRGLIGAAELDAIGPEGYLVNTARGELVDQAALVDALAEGRLAGAALDVYAEEPLPPSSPLTEMDDVILGSHNAQNTHEAVSRVNERAIANLITGLE